MKYRPPGTLGLLRLLAKNSVLRLLRAARVQKAKRTAQPGEGRRRRAATPRKGSGGLMWLMVLMLPLFLLQALFISAAATNHLLVAGQSAAEGQARFLYVEPLLNARIQLHSGDRDAFDRMLDDDDVDEYSSPPRSRVEEHFDRYGKHGFRASTSSLVAADIGPAATEVFVQCAAVLLLVLTLACLCTAFGGASANLAGGEWVQAWLATFPVQNRALVLARALEYALVQFFPWFLLWPLTWRTLAVLGVAGALPLSLLATLATTFLLGAVRLWGETELRLRCSLHTLKNVQGACALLSLAGLGFGFWVALGDRTPAAFVSFARSLPDVVQLLPGAWAVGFFGFGWVAVLIGLATSVFAFTAAIRRTSSALRGGVMRSGGVDAGSRGRAGGWRKGRALGVLGKELSLLRRDRTFLVQTLLVPAFIIVLQLVLNPGLGRARGVGLAMIAYFVGFYGSTGGCFQVLSNEGRALWMLYSLPVEAADVLRRKVRLWAGLSCLFATVALVVFSVRAAAFESVPFEPVLFAQDLAFVLFGVFCASHIAAALSVFGANTTADSVQKTPKQRYQWLYMFLASAFVVALASDELAHRLRGAVVYGTLAYAVWQRAVGRLRWLLDPSRDVRDEITLLDAGAAMLSFFLVLTAAAALMSAVGVRGGDAWIWTVAFVIGGVTTLVVLLVRLGSRGVRIAQELGFDVPAARALLWSGLGVVIGVLLGIGGLGYVAWLKSLAPDLVPEPPPGSQVALLLLGVGCAPVVEEMLFRGVLLRGLMRSVPAFVAIVWSALLFAFVHQVASWPPVFVLGFACAVLRHRTGSLLACMAAHAAYNLVVIGWQ